MLDFIEMFGVPFLACALIGSLLSYLGMHVLKREVIFIDIAVAQVAAIGALAAHMIFHVEEDALVSYVFSIGCVLAMAGFYSVVRWKVTNISIEAVIGISYAITAAGALFLIGIEPGHAHAHEILAGNLLWVTWPSVLAALVVFVLIAVVLYLFRRPLSAVSEHHDNPDRHGLNVAWWDFVFYALLGIAITMAVRLSGVVTVFAMLIIPATTSALFPLGTLGRLCLAWIAVVIGSLGGLLASYHHDFSAGPAIALCLGILLLATAIIARLRPSTTLTPPGDALPDRP